jgi:hypothetical protein
MGRGPVWEWLLARPFLPEACAPGSVSGISGPFEPLSRSPRWVTHVLLTRPPLTVRVSPNGSLDLHVLGTPPAFALSQDQTLQFDFGILHPVIGLATEDGAKGMHTISVSQ